MPKRTDFYKANINLPVLILTLLFPTFSAEFHKRKASMNISREKAGKLVSSPYAWGVLVLLTLVYISSFVDRQIIAVLAAQIREGLGLSNLEVGLLYGPSFSLIYAFCGILMGRLADLYSRKWMIVIGLTVWSLMTALSGFANSLFFLIAARMAVGVSQSALSPSVYSLLADYFRPSQRALVYSVYASGIFIGIGTAFLVGGSIAQQYDWRTALLAVGLPGVFLAVVVALVLKELPRGLTQKKDESEAAETESSTGFREVLLYMYRKPTIILHNLGFAFQAIIGYTMLGYISVLLVDRFEAGGLIPHYGWFMLATGLSVMISGRLADMLGRKGGKRRFWMAVVAAVGGLPLYVAGLYAESGMTALLCVGTAAVISSSYNGIAPAILQYLVKPDMRALAGGVYLFVISVVGLGVGPPLAGYFMDSVFTGGENISHSLITVIAFAAAAATACYLLAMRFYEKDAVES